jgi:hypothetical protein
LFQPWGSRRAVERTRQEEATTQTDTTKQSENSPRQEDQDWAAQAKAARETIYKANDEFACENSLTKKNTEQTI